MKEIYPFRLLWLVLLLLLVCHCTIEPVIDIPNEPIQDPILPTGSENYLNINSDYIFNQNQLHTFELNISPENLRFLDDDPTREQYVEGSLTFEGETLSPVGIRYKGSIGAFVGCVSGSDWTNPSGRKTCTKLSMKIKINWLDKDLKFYDLKKLQFHSMNLDDSQMRDRLGYYLFREMGVPTPRSVHARLIINGEYSGLYSLVEQIDGRFTRYHFEDGKGNLYKEIWPLRDNGQPYPRSEYINNLKTNEEDSPTAEMMLGFATDIKNAPEDSMQSIVRRWMDVDEIMSYIAVDRTIRVDDGPFHWYCGGSSCTNHNYYWYEQNKTSTMHLIPWDLDNSFENIVFDRNPVTPIADGWGVIRENCQPFRYGTFNLTQRSAACDKLTAGWAIFTEEYEQKREVLKKGPMSKENIENLLRTWSEQISQATEDAHQMHGDAVNPSTWAAAVQDLERSLEYARNK